MMRLNYDRVVALGPAAPQSRCMTPPVGPASLRVADTSPARLADSVSRSLGVCPTRGWRVVATRARAARSSEPSAACRA